MIDPSILLDSRPVQIQTPLDAALGARSLQNLTNQGQLQQGQIAAQPGQLQAQDLQNQQTQQQLRQTQAINDAYANAFTPGVNGAAPTFDTAKLQSALATHNAGSAIPGLMKGILDNQKAASDLADSQTKVATDLADYAGGIAKTVKDAGYSPQLLITQAQQGIAANPQLRTIAQPIIDELTQSLKQDPTGAQAKALTQQLADHLISASPAQQKLVSEAQTSQGAADRGTAALGELTLKQTQAATQDAATRLSKATTATDYAAILNALPHGIALKFPAPETWNAQTTPASALQAGMTPDQQASTLATQTRDANTASNEAAHLRLEAQRIQQENANRESVNLTPSARDQMATYFATTGQLPNLGMGAAVAQTRAEIINRAAEMFPNVTFASNAANYQANKASLKNVQGTLDTLSAFENSGLKNLKMFTDAAAQIPDTGIPWLNVPVRMLDEKLVGDQNMSVVNAARQIGLREIARVTNDPKLSGVLSDSARKEVQDFSPTNATLPQIIAVAKTLQQDMANVHSSLSDQRDAINNRIGTNPTAKPAGGGAASSGGYSVTDGNGKVHPFATQAQADAFKALVKAQGGSAQ